MAESPHCDPRRGPRRPANGFVRPLLLLLGFLSHPGGIPNMAMQAPPSFPPFSGPHVRGIPDEQDREDPFENEKRLRAMNADRQRSMVSDAGKLLRIAADLNAQVAAADSPSLTAAQLRQLAEIEKLAHSVKEKMSTSVRGIPVFPLQPRP